MTATNDYTGDREIKEGAKDSSGLVHMATKGQISNCPKHHSLPPDFTRPLRILHVHPRAGVIDVGVGRCFLALVDKLDTHLRESWDGLCRCGRCILNARH